MCGIVGFITKESTKLAVDREKFLRQALIIDTLRGDDSTGVFAVGHEQLFDDGTAYWYKQLGGGGEFVDSTGYWENFYDVEQYRAVVGHNRAATVGAVNTDGAHPFQVGPITLVHNGTLRQTHRLPTPMHKCMVPTGEEGLPGPVSVDSHAVAYNLANHTVEEVVKSMHGAYTLVWHDARDDSMNIIRNSERPLHMSMSKQQDTLYFMSEAGMLHLLDSRLKLGLSSIYYPKPGQWLKWLPDTELTAPEVRTLEMATNYSTGSYNSYWNLGTFEDDDEDDVWWNYRASNQDNSGKAYASYNKVFVGGETKEVPGLLQEVLLDYDLMVEDRLSFTPKTSIARGERRSIVGMLDNKYKAILYNHVKNGVMDQDWTVRPLAVQVSDSGEPLIVCRLVSFVHSTNKGRTSLFDANEIKSHDEIKYINGEPHLKEAGSPVWTPVKRGVYAQGDDEGRAMLGYDTSYTGPNGSSLTADEYYAATSDGCMGCHRTVSIADADDLVWTDDGEEFLCWECDALGNPNFVN